MKKSISKIIILALSFMFSLILFKLPAEAAEPTVINLSDLEEGQALELQEDKKELTIQFCEDATKSNHHIKLMYGDTTLTAGEDYFYDIDDNSENGILSVVFPELEYYFENLYKN